MRARRENAGSDLAAAETADQLEVAPVERWPGKRTLLTTPVRRHGSGAPGKMSLVQLEALLASGRGEALPGALRGRLARRLGEDLDDVRVHTGPEADHAARLLSAEAFTVGRDIYFAAGRYDPDSRAGQRLIAHEAAHTVQHGAAPSGGAVEVSSAGDAHEVQADRFADEFLAAPVRGRAPGEPARILRPDAPEAPRLVTPVGYAGVSRFPGGPFPGGPSSGPILPTKSLTSISVDDVKLFSGDSFTKKWTHLDESFPLAKGVFAVGGIPVTFNADAALHLSSYLGAGYGDGMVEGIKVQLSTAEAVALGLAPDRAPIEIPLLPFDPFDIGPTISVGPNLKDAARRHILSSEHTAEGTARVSATAGAGMNGSASVSGGVAALDIFGGGVTGGVYANASAIANARANAYAKFKYKSGTVTVTALKLGAEFDFAWNLGIGAYAGIYVELKMPHIPVISDLTHAVQDWPVIGWITPDLTKLKWRKDFTKNWDIISEAGTRHWKKEWEIIADGSSPSATAPMGLPSPDSFDFGSVIKTLVEGGKLKKDIPAEDDGPDKELKDGAKDGAVAATRQAAKAQVKSARENVKREKNWNKKELTKVKKAIAAAAKASPKPAGGGTVQQGGAPSLAVPGGGTPSGTPDEQRKTALEARDDKLEKADSAAQNVDKKIDEVKGAAEGAQDGPSRNQAREGFEALGQNADKLGQAVGGYGDGAKEFERPPDAAAPVKPHSAEADKKRLECRQLLDEVSEKVNTELIRCDKEWHDANAVPELASYNVKVDGYRSQIRIDCERKLKTLNKDWEDINGFPNPDEQITHYDDTMSSARAIRAKYDELERTLKPKVPWDKDWAVLEDRKLLVAKRARFSIRETFYKKRPSTKTWMLNKIQKRTGPKTGQEEWYWAEADPVSKYTGEPHWFLLNSPNDEEPTIAHDDPPVVKHWNGPGRTTSQEVRNNYFAGTDKGQPTDSDDDKRDKNLGIEPSWVNKSRGNKYRSIPYNPEVTVSFTGPK